MVKPDAYVSLQYWNLNPCIIFQNTDLIGNLDLYPSEPVIRIIYRSAYDKVSWIEKVITRCLKDRPQDQVFYMVQNWEQFRELKKRGYPVFHGNHNMFINDRVFNINSDFREGTISISALHQVKRLELQVKIPEHSIIGTLKDKSSLAIVENSKMKWVNREKGSFLSSSDVSRVLNSSWAGVLTSEGEEEGNCRAITEYLLCGIPFVSTYPHEMIMDWVTPYNCLWAEETAEDVRSKTQQICGWLRDQPDLSFKIRETAMGFMQYLKQNLQRTLLKAAKNWGFSDFYLDIDYLIYKESIIKWKTFSQEIKKAPHEVKERFE